MSCKDAVVKKRILNKQQEFENIIGDIYLILEKLKGSVTEATEAVLNTDPTINRRQFRSAYAKSVQTIEACTLKAIDARANLQHESDDEASSDDNEDLDCQSIVSSDFIKSASSSVSCSAGPVLHDRVISEKFELNCITSSTELQCESPTPLQSQSLPSDGTDVATTQDRTRCLNAAKHKDVLFDANSSPPCEELTKQAASSNDVYDDRRCAVFSEENKFLSPQQKSNAGKQQSNCLGHGDSQCQPPMFDVNSEESGETITNKEPTGEDIIGCEAKLGHLLLSNQVCPTKTEGQAHQLKDLNIDELVNTLAHLTNANPESECFHKQVENIYKHAVPNVSGAIDKFNPSGLITAYNPSLCQGSGEPPAIPHDQFLSTAKPNHTSNVPALITSTPAFLCNAVSSAGYNFEPFSKKTTQMAVPVFSGAVMPLADQKIEGPEKLFHHKVAPGFSPILTPTSKQNPDVCDVIAATFSERGPSPSPGFPKDDCSAVSFAFPQIQLDVGSGITATMGHINSPSSFYVMPTNNNVSLEDLTAKLGKCYSGSYLGLFTNEATVGLICCAFSSNDNNWYRAVIIEVHAADTPGFIDEKVTVRLVDKGITEKLPLFRLRSLNEDFWAIPCLVVHCALHNAKPPLNQTEWTEEQIDTFSSLACRNEIEVKVHGKLVTGEFDVDLKTLERSGSETIKVSILDCFINAACCIEVSNSCDNTPRATPVPIVTNSWDNTPRTTPVPVVTNSWDNTPTATPVPIIIPDENKNSKISFTINCKKNPVLETFRKKKSHAKKSKRQYRTTRVSNDTSSSNDDQPNPESALKTPKCWEDLDSKSSVSSVEKLANVSNTVLNEKISPASSPFPILHNIDLNLSKHSFQEAMLAHVVSPSEFYVHPVVEETTCIDELTSELNKIYSKAQAPLAIVDKQSIPTGSFWCAKFPKDGQWYRAKVVDVKEIEDTSDKLNHEFKKKKKKLKTKSNPLESKFKVHVFYVDYGDSAWIESNDLRHLKKKFYKHPIMAIRCTLMSVYPRCDPNSTENEGNPAWPPEAGKALEDWAGEKTVTIQIFDEEEYQKTGQFTVLLWDSENEGILFNEEIVKLGLAESNIYCKEKPEEPQRAENKEQDELENLSSWDPMSSDFKDLRNSYDVDVDDAGVALTGYKACDESLICMFYQRGQLCKRGSSCRYKHIRPSSDGQTTDKKVVMGSIDIVALPNINSLVAVEVTEVLNATHFYVNFPFSTKPLSKLKEEADSQVLTTESENLITLQTKLQSVYKDEFPHHGDYLLRAEGEIVVAKFSTDNEWYRARVIRTDPGRSRVKVFYVDYGNCEWVYEINVRDIRPEFMHFPFQAVECRLADIELRIDDTESMKLSRAVFKQQVVNRQLVAHIKDIVGNTLYVDLFYTENETDVNIKLILVSMQCAKHNIGFKSTSPSTSKKMNVMPA